jgi:metallo-beta-lactamase class B
MDAMKRLFFLIVLIFLPLSLKAAEPVKLGADLTIEQLTPTVWMHTSTKRYPGGVLVPSNGLLVIDHDTSILIDTAWNDEQTERIYKWASEQLHKLVRVAIVTHSHDDRIGGIGCLRGHNVKVLGSGMTRDLALMRNVSAPEASFDLKPGEATTIEGLEVFYPGPGHAPDNLVIWLPSDHLLFGGCLIKSADAGNLGFTGDADINNWPTTVRLVQSKYPNATLVVPGHGNPGDMKLLQHTLDLLKASPATQPLLR